MPTWQQVVVQDYRDRDRSRLAIDASWQTLQESVATIAAHLARGAISSAAFLVSPLASSDKRTSARCMNGWMKGLGSAERPVLP